MDRSVKLGIILCQSLFLYLFVLAFITIDGQAQPDQNATATNQTGEESQLIPFTIPRSSEITQDNTQTSSSPSVNSIRANEADIILLSQRYNQERFSDTIVGEVENNGTATADFVQVTVSFYDSNGQIVGREFTYADPSTVEPGMRSPFEVFITSDTIQDETETYEFTLQWTNPDGSKDSTRVMGETAESQDGDNDDNDSDNDNNSDGDDEDD
ncbi:MAG TPA: FxLYD domain-containing protein [Nitrososphaeraceae archaeon]|jgi:hypothetical protein|nr:FxLYD domain-containing protein [Nitrososphaeraceae archaeon]